MLLMAEDQVRLLPELARQIASEKANALKIVIVENAHLAGILANLLVKNHAIAKKDIAQSSRCRINILRRHIGAVRSLPPIQTLRRF